MLITLKKSKKVQNLTEAISTDKAISPNEKQNPIKNLLR